MDGSLLLNPTWSCYTSGGFSSPHTLYLQTWIRLTPRFTTDCIKKMEGDVKVPHTCVLLNGHGGSNSYGCKVKLDFIHILLLFNIFICVLLFLSQPQSENSCTFCPSVRPPPNMCSDFSEYHKKEGCCSPYSSNLSIYANSIGIYNLISTDCLWNTDFTDSLFSMCLGVRLCTPNFGVCERWRLWGRRWRCHIFVRWAQRLEEGKMSGVHECGSKKTMT